MADVRSMLLRGLQGKFFFLPSIKNGGGKRSAPQGLYGNLPKKIFAPGTLALQNGSA